MIIMTMNEDKNDNMNEKVLSISIAAYNVARFLERTLSSLTTDTDCLDRIEIIVVNDESKDRTSDIAHKFEQEHPDSIIVIDKSNGGYGSTINASLKVAKGKYYKLLDGDDWYNENTLSDYVNFLSNTNADLVVSPYIEYNDVTKTERIVDNHPEVPPKKIETKDIVLNNARFPMHEIAVKTVNLRNMNLAITEHCYYTDTEYVLFSLMASASIARYEHPVYCYRIGIEGQSVSLAGMRKHCQELLKVADTVYGQYRKISQQGLKKNEQALDQCITDITYKVFCMFMILEDRKKAKKDLQQFDRGLKADSNTYSLGNRSQIVRSARLLHFRLFFLFRMYALNKYEI